MADIYNPILDAVTAAILGLNLTLGSRTVAVEKRKLPAVQEEIDTLPLICVVPDPKVLWDVPFATGGIRKRGYGTGIAVVSKGDHDARKHLADYTGWRDAIADLLARPPAGFPDGYLEHRIQLGVTIDPQKYSQNYDYSAMAVYWTVVVRP